MQKGTIRVQNQLTQQEAEKVADALHSVWGVRRAEVNLSSNEATFSYDENAASYADFQQAIRDLGFSVDENTNG